jgi:hypothetical protein
MFSVIRKRFTYANVAMTLALVFAMTGGAFAAGKYLITSTKQIKPSVLKQFHGKAGPAGKEGPAGKNGTNGTQGPAGEKGPAGPEGKEGKAGPEGKEGKTGATGQTGFTATLPSKATETGDWDLDVQRGAEAPVSTSVSFNIQLAAPLINAKECGAAGKPACVVHMLNSKDEEAYIEGTEVKHKAPTGCPGNVEEPGAEPGNLCIFTKSEENIDYEYELVRRKGIKACRLAVLSPFLCASLQVAGGQEKEGEGADATGFAIAAIEQTAEPLMTSGTWAVTAP